MVQKTVGILPDLGLPGQEAVLGSARYLAYNPLSDGTVVVGSFAFAKTAGGTDGAPFAIVSGTGEAAQAPLGLVERVQDETITNLLSDGTNVIPEGGVVEVALQGQFYIVVPAGLSGITTGMKVLVTPTTGAINLAAAAGEGEVDTGWTVVVPNGGASAGAGAVVIAQKLN